MRLRELQSRERQRQERRRSQDRHRGRSRSIERKLNNQREELEKLYRTKQTEQRGRYDAAMALVRTDLNKAQADLMLAQGTIAALEKQLLAATASASAAASALALQAQVPVQVTAPYSAWNPEYHVPAPHITTHPLVGTYLLPGTGPSAWNPVNRQTKGKDPIWNHASQPNIDWARGKHWYNTPFYMVDDQSIRVYPVVYDSTSANTVLQVSTDELHMEGETKIRNIAAAKARAERKGKEKAEREGKGGGKGKGNGAGGKGRGGIPARGRGRAQFPPQAFNDGHQEPLAGDRLGYQGYYDENPYQPIAPAAAAAAPLLLLQADGATPQQEQD